MGNLKKQNKTKMLAHDERLTYGHTGMVGAVYNPMMNLYDGKHAVHSAPETAAQKKQVEEIEAGGLPLMALYQKKASEMGMHDELHEKPHMLGAVYNPMMELYKLKHESEMVRHDEVHDRHHMLGDVRGLPLMELYQKKASEMGMHDELHEKPHMLGAVYHPEGELAMHDETKTDLAPHMLGASAPLVYLYQKKVNELATHDETKKDLAPHMLGATYKNPFHVSQDAPVKGMTYIPQINKINDLTGFDVKPKIIMLI